MRGKNILVAGGTGLIGANLTKRLKVIGANFLTTYFTREPSFLKENYKRFDFTKLEDCIEATKDMDYVFFCAAQVSGVKMMKENPTAFILQNLKINAGLLEACARNGVEKVVLISSATVYQEVHYPIQEDQLDLNKLPYELYFGIGWLNRYIEQLAKLYYKEHKLKIGIVRASYIYGPHDNFDDEKSHVVPALIKRALKKEVPYIVWGDGSAIRDLIYVEDLVDDLLDILNRYCICDPINISSGVHLSIRNIVKVILNVCGHDVIPQYDETKPTGIPYRVLNTAKFGSIFGKKKRTVFEDGIKKTSDWYKSTSDSKK